ncbi:MAG: class II aldolase/adducin family protein [Woeseiaceae bacterium]|nr:class II aldolase/adducin family protein [Woeseiaceae bacterium]
MPDEGYIKYRSHWSPGPAPDAAAVRILDEWRRPLFAAGLIGQYKEHEIGFGNISIRYGQTNQFLITGTQTGHVEYSDETHYSLVTSYDIERNEVSCTGPLQASSEAMTHAAIYELDPSIKAIVHVHSKPLWTKHLNEMCTTQADIQYGTPEMAQEFRRLYEETPFRSEGIAVMGGHEEGLLSFGTSLEQAATRVLALTEDWKD